MSFENSSQEPIRELLFNGLLISIEEEPFSNIIQNDLHYYETVYRTYEADGLVWLYRADRKSKYELNIYSFRFPNACHPDFYREFNGTNHYSFLPILKPRHHSEGWYKYTRRQLLEDIEEYLNINRFIPNNVHHTANLFINQDQERVDIQFDFKSIKERISFTFEPGYPIATIF